MPCYDKKLEASRQDFHNDIYSTRDVDCVITTGELEVMMRERGFDLSLSVPGEDGSPNILGSGAEFPELMVHPGTSSGSYLHSLIELQKLASPTPLDLAVKAIRSSDYEEYTLKNPITNEIVFKGAKCYGFRNLQNVVRKVGREAGVQVGKGAAGKAAGGLRARVKRKTGAEREGEGKGLDYVEVMACPGGCVNGGGQLKPPTASTTASSSDAEGYARNWEDSGVEMGVEGVLQNAKWGDKEWTKRVEKAYWHDLPTPPSSPKPVGATAVAVDSAKEADALASRILVDLCQPTATTSAWAQTMDTEAESLRRMLFRTEYRAVESEVVGLAVKW